MILISYISAAVLASTIVAPAAPAAEMQREPEKKAQALSLEELRALRSKLAWKKRRIIVNSDGNELWSKTLLKGGVASREAFLKERTSGLVGSQVDAIFYCTSMGIGLFYHNTKVGNIYDELIRNQGKTMIRRFFQAGLDPLTMMTDFAHAHQMELFWSLRMNDTHDGNFDDYGRVVFDQNRFKAEHPEYLLGAYGEKGKKRVWSGVNYALPEVQDYVASVIAEVCRDYPVDGIELDFFRHLAYFKSTPKRRAATPEEIESMNGLIRRIRLLTEEEGLKRGRPILVSAKVPDSVEYSKAVGLDLEEWLKNGWIDILMTTGYFRLHSWDYSVALGHRYGIPVYPSLDDSRIPGDDGGSSKLRMNSLLCYRGQALEAWKAGADGIYLFNIYSNRAFPPGHELFRELGDPQQLRFFDKDYFANVRGNVAGTYGISAAPYRDGDSLSMLSPAAPEELTPKGVRIPFPVADDFKAAKEAGKKPVARLRLRFKGLQDLSQCVLSINKNPIPTHSAKAEGDWIEISVDPNLFLRKGKNILEITSVPDTPPGAQLLDLQVQVRYHSL